MITCDDEIRRRKRKISCDAINGAIKINSITIVMLDYFLVFPLLEKTDIFFIIYTVNLLRRMETSNVR